MCEITQAIEEGIRWMTENLETEVNHLIADPADIPADAMIIVLDGCTFAWV